MSSEGFHAARWDEPLIMEMGTTGERGVLPPLPEPGICAVAGNVSAKIPAALRRTKAPHLPELAQPQVLRHYLRLSQMTMGAHLTPDASLGTCTMKYSPAVDEYLARSPNITELHPRQGEDTVQGMLEIVWRFGEILREISGMDAVSFQPGGGTQAIYTNACIIRAHHEARGQLDQRDEIITTAFSHPANAAAPAVAGFRIVTLMPGPDGYPEVEALKAALSDRTAGLMMTNPEDTGIFNPNIDEFTRLVHSVGGLCAYDQANANGILGITRARDCGFDLCHFNLHKTFSVPHGSMGPAAAVVCVTNELAQFLPIPVVVRSGEFYRLDYDRPDSIGKVRSFYGNLMGVVRAYAWVMSLGAEGLRAVAETAILNNNYLAKRLAGIRGVSIPFAGSGHRVEQVRYSWQSLAEDTGIGTEDVKRRLADFGLQGYFTSHHPVLVPEPFTLEPTESYSKADLDQYVRAFEEISREAYEEPHVVASAPHRASTGRVDESMLHDPARCATTWRAWRARQEAPAAGHR